MKKFKKTIVLTMLVIFTCFFAACGKDNTNNSGTREDMAGNTQTEGQTNGATNNTDAGAANGATNGATGNTDAGAANGATSNPTDTATDGGILEDAGNAVGDMVDDAANGVENITNDVVGQR